MATEAQRKEALDLIRENIARRGYHLYVVVGGSDPRFAYTIGLRDSLGAELILPRAAFYSIKEVGRIIDDVAAQLNGDRTRAGGRFEIGSLGSFSLREVHPTWAKALMLGALDYYKADDVSALQIIPDQIHWTTDVPNLGEQWSADTAPGWRWLHEPWDWPIPSKSIAITDLRALYGERVTEAMRWEEDEWELFAGAGPDVTKDELRIVPIGTLIAFDKSLEAVLNLNVEEGLWRSDAEPEWHPWRKRDVQE